MRIVQTFWTGGRFKTSNEGGLTKCQSGLESGEASALADGGSVRRSDGVKGRGEASPLSSEQREYVFERWGAKRRSPGRG